MAQKYFGKFQHACRVHKCYRRQTYDRQTGDSIYRNVTYRPSHGKNPTMTICFLSPQHSVVATNKDMVEIRTSPHHHVLVINCNLSFILPRLRDIAPRRKCGGQCTVYLRLPEDCIQPLWFLVGPILVLLFLVLFTSVLRGNVICAEVWIIFCTVLVSKHRAKVQCALYL